MGVRARVLKWGAEYYGCGRISRGLEYSSWNTHLQVSREFNSGVKFPSRGWNTQETAAVYGGQKVTEYYGA